MKTKIRVMLLFLACSLVTKAHALTVELFDVSGDQLSSKIDFNATRGGILYHEANQYLKINNPGNIQREVHIYADRSAWQGSSEAQPVSMEALPLLGLQFPSLQPLGVAFTPDNEISWTKIGDAGAPDSDQNKLILKPNEVRYVYFGTKLLDSMPSSTYSSKVLVAVLDAPAPQAADVRPKETVVSPNGDGVNDVANFGISGTFEIKLFNVRGKTVRTLQNNSAWDGRDNNGDYVESGVYVYKVKADGVNVSGMLAVAR